MHWGLFFLTIESLEPVQSRLILADSNPLFLPFFLHYYPPDAKPLELPGQVPCLSWSIRFGVIRVDGWQYALLTILLHGDQPELAPPLLFFHMRLLYDISSWMLQISHYHEP